MHEGTMKPGQSGQNGKQRSRGRSINGGGKKHLPPRNQTYDSNGPDIRIRGNAHQVLEKYLAMARDASSQGDRVSAENFYQHAEHYFRVINNQNQSNGRQPLRAMPTPADDQEMTGNEGEGEGEERENGSEEEESESGDVEQVEEAASA
jgi:hypothetical protein